MGDADQSQLVTKARLAEQAERYEDMVNEMKKIVYLGNGLQSEERNLLSVAYKNVIGARRSSWRTINAIDSKVTDSDPKYKRQIKDYRTKIEKELQESCDDVLLILDKHLIPQANESAVENADKYTDSRVFYYKMKGDYYRYLAEVSDPSKKDSPMNNARDAYEEAVKLAEGLPTVHPIRLGLALNFSVFFYEINGDHARACKVAQEAFDKALSELDSLVEETYKDSTLILQLIRDNLTLWTSEGADSEPEGEKIEDIEDQELDQPQEEQ